MDKQRGDILTQAELDSIAARCLSGDPAALKVYPAAATELLTDIRTAREKFCDGEEYERTWNVIIAQIDEILMTNKED